MDLVGEDHVQALPGRQCTEGWVGAVDLEGIATVLVEDQLAEVATDQAVVCQPGYRACDAGGGAAGHRGECAARDFQAVAHAIDLELGRGWLIEVVDVGVGAYAGIAGDHVPAGIGRPRAAIGSSRAGSTMVIHGHRRIVGALNGDHQHGDRGQAVGIDHLVGELLDQRLAWRKRLNGGIAVVDDVAVAAVSVDGQAAEAGGHAGRLAIGHWYQLAAPGAIEADCVDLPGFA